MRQLSQQTVVDMGNMTSRVENPLFVLLCLLMCAAGGHAPASARLGFVMMSEEEEIKIGEQVARQVLQQYRPYDNRELQDYVQAVGEKLAALGERPQLKYRFMVLDSEEVNAFAVPGGHIFVTRGLLAYLNSEAELAAVLGHEVGHIAARHAARQQSTAALTDILGKVAAIATGVQGADLLTGLLGTAFVRGYGRDMELEADHLGAEYMARAGYAREALLRVIGVLKDQETFEIEQAREEGRKPQVYHGIFATHPDQDTRLKEAVGVLGELEPGAASIENKHTYLHFVDGLIYGKHDSRQPARAGAFVHPTLGVTLKLPLGWQVDTGKSTLLARSPSGDAALHVGVERMQGRASPEEFLTRRLGKLEMVRKEPLSTGGLAGFTAVALAAPSPFGARAVRYGVVYVDEKAFVLAGAAERTTDPYEFDREFLQAIRSLRPMTRHEQQMAAPAVVRVLQADPATRIEQLAAESRLPKYAEQQIRLINGLYPDGEPTPGEYVKTLE
jgi:predicted Zn-dependent protease